MVEHLQIVCISDHKFNIIRPLRIRWAYLLDSGNMSSNIFNSDRVFDSKTVTLTFYTRTVN